MFLVPAHSTSPLFVLPHGRLLRPIFALQFDQFFKSCISVVGLCPSQYSARSFRREGATFAFNCGAPTEFIKAQGDWQSDAYLIYLKLSTQKKLDILHAISARLSHFSFKIFFSFSSIHPFGFGVPILSLLVALLNDFAPNLICVVIVLSNLVVLALSKLLIRDTAPVHGFYLSHQCQVSSKLASVRPRAQSSFAVSLR